jgi:isoleucyl-tRNA synthetase
VLYHILNSYLILLTPIIPHTCGEVYKFFNKQNKLESVHLENWINELNISLPNSDNEKWKQFDELKDLIFTKLEELRTNKIINKNNEAIVKIKFNNHHSFKENELKKYLNVAKVVIENLSTSDVVVEVDNAKLIKCERCWNYFDKQEMHNEHVCNRCSSVLEANNNSI